MSNRRLSVTAILAAVFLSLSYCLGPGQAVAAPGGGPPHVYLMRGLMNVFSLGMDDLADKLNRRGIAASVYNHSGWEAIAQDIAANYKAGKIGPIILIGHSFGADAVMHMGSYLGKNGVPVALIIPLDASGPLPAPAGVRRVMNLTQRDYARMTRGPGFKGELQNIDLTKDQSIGHLNIDKSPRLHTMMINKIQSVIGRGGGRSMLDTAKNTAPKTAVAGPAVTSSVAAAPAPAATRAAPPEPVLVSSPPPSDVPASPPKLRSQLPD